MSSNLEILSLTSDRDLVIAKLDNYYLCLAEPSKRVRELGWYEATDYCRSLGEGYYLPSKEELNLIYTSKGDLSLVEAIQYETDINTIDYISTWLAFPESAVFSSWIWSSMESNSGGYILSIDFENGEKCYDYHNCTTNWTLPIRRIVC